MKEKKNQKAGLMTVKNPLNTTGYTNVWLIYFILVKQHQKAKKINVEH